MNTEKIKPNTNFMGKNIAYFKTTDSTNTVAKENPYKEGTMVVADSQTNGRGRMGRSWLSRENEGIFLSIVLYPKIQPEYVNCLTLIAGISLCRVLTRLCDVPFKIKWPNDIVAQGKKVCGILTEGVLSEKSQKAIVGIGVNVNNTSFPEDLSEKATSLYMLTGKCYSREYITEKIAEDFEVAYLKFLEGKPFCDEYEKMCVNIGKSVTATKDGNTITGTATGILKTGELVIKKEDGTILEINSGEVSVRGIYGYY